MAIGLTWGLGMLLMGLITCVTETYGHAFVAVMGSVYLGYEPGSVLGAVIGFAWGFVDGFIAVAVIGLIYKALSKCGSSCCSKADKLRDAPPA
jgi:hypothetical protein